MDQLPPPPPAGPPDVPDDATITWEIPVRQIEPGDRPYNPAKDRERARSRIAIGLLVMLGAVLFASFGTLWIVLWKAKSLEGVKDLLGLIYSPLIALVGTATGFYFGGSNNQQSQP